MVLLLCVETVLIINGFKLTVTRAGPARQLPGAPTHKRRHDVTAIIGNMVLVNAGVHMLQQCLRKIIRNLGTALKMSVSPVLGLKSLKKIGLRWHQIINLPGAPKYLGPALIVTC